MFLKLSCNHIPWLKMSKIHSVCWAFPDIYYLIIDLLGASFDVLEQHQAKEQTRLLQKFKELRQWQQQQQQQLMLQQHQQLKAWKEEQDQVQMLITTQQVTQWNKGTSLGLTSSVVMTDTSIMPASYSWWVRQIYASATFYDIYPSATFYDISVAPTMSNKLAGWMYPWISWVW